MADMPWRFWSMDLKEGTKLVLAALWRHARSEEREACMRGGAAPFVWPTIDRLSRLVGRCTSAVEKDLKALREGGLIARDRANVGGRTLSGWRLIAGPGDDAADTVPASTPAAYGPPPTPVGDRRTDEAVRPAGVPPTPVGGETHGPDAGPLQAYGPTPYARRALPPTPVGTEARREAREKPEGDVDEDLVKTETRATAPAARVDRDTKPDNSEPIVSPAPKARRPQTLVDGEVPGSTPESFARLLLLELGQLYVPTLPNGRADETRRIRTNDRQVLARAERLLAVPLEGLSDDDAKQARRERFGYVLEQCRQFADLCRRDKAKAAFWGPFMLETDAAAGKTMSRWSMLERDVSTAASTAAAIEVQQRAAEAASRPPPAKPEPKETPEEIAEREERAARYKAQVESMFGSVAKSTRLPVTVRPDDERSEETARRQGPRREAQAERDEDRELEIRRRINAALAAARDEARRLHGEDATLTSAQADAIRRRVREDAEGRTR